MPARGANEICRARVCIAAPDRAPERRGTDRSGSEREADEARGGFNERNVCRAGMYLHSPPPVTPVLIAPAEIDLNIDVLERASAQCERQLKFWL